MEMRLLRAHEMALFYTRDLDDAFPAAELKPLRVMEEARQTGKYHPWGLFDGEDLVGGAFKTVAYVLPFANAVDACRAAMEGRLQDIWQTLWVVCAWAVGLMIVAIVLFTRKMKAK